MLKKIIVLIIILLIISFTGATCYEPSYLDPSSVSEYITQSWEKAFPQDEEIEGNNYDYIAFPGATLILTNNNTDPISYISSGGTTHENNPFFALKIGDYGSDLQFGFEETTQLNIELLFLVDMSGSFSEEKQILSRHWNSLLQTIESQGYNINATKYEMSKSPSVVSGYPSGYTKPHGAQSEMEAWGGHGSNVMKTLEATDNGESQPIRFMFVLADNHADGSNNKGSEYQKHINDFIEQAKDKNVYVYFMYDELEGRNDTKRESFEIVSEALDGEILSLTNRIESLMDLVAEKVIDKTASLRSDIYSNALTGIAESSNKRYCDPSGLPGPKIGFGTSNQITMTFNDIASTGGYEYLTQYMKKPIGGTYGANPERQNQATGTVYFSQPVSVLVFGSPSENKFLEDNDGTHIEQITFTILSKSYTDVNIIDYKINCGTEITCTLDDSYKGYVVGGENNRLIVPGTIEFKKDFPKEIIYNIDLNYTLPDLSSYSEYDQIYKTSSKPTQLTFGLIDKQDFRIKMVTDTSKENCIAVDGSVGQTGEEIAPKINLVFGGGEEEMGAISVDECDTTDINGNPRDWVYCTQSEFLIELVRKIGEMVRLQKNIDDEISHASANNRAINQEIIDSNQNELNKYKNSEVNIRELRLDIDNLSNSITNLPISLFDKIGLEFYSDVGLNGSKSELKEQSLEIIKNTKFSLNINNSVSQSTTYSPGTYSMELEVNLKNDYKSKQLIYDLEGRIEPNYDIEVTFVKQSNPKYDWFFYEFGISDTLNESINIETGPKFELLNNGGEELLSNGNIRVIDRGTVFRFTQDRETSQVDLDNATIYGSSAHPIFIKFGNYNNKLNNSFNITHPEAMNLSGHLGYWTAFASNKERGCSPINPELNSLSYYISDLISISQGNNTQLVSLSDIYPSNLEENSIEYMHSVIYLPQDRGTTNNNQIILKGDAKIYSENKNNLENNELKLQSGENEFMVTNLQTLFDRIRDESICVNKKSYVNETDWVLFWNENKVLSSLNEEKEKVLDNTNATICPNRKID